VERRDCEYVKLRCRGFGETPSVEQTRSFIEFVDEFSQRNPIDIVGIHCTHGFNRTGFLIVSYLVEKHDYDVAAAVQEFARARSPGIYKQEYINELFKRYGDEEDTLMAPALPQWCFEEEETPDEYSYDQEPSTSNGRKRKRENEQHKNSGEAQDENEEEDNDEGSSNGNVNKRRRKNENLKLDATFMPGVPGVTLMTDKKFVNDLQHKIQDMCEFEKHGFPGSQPVSMDRDNLRFLHAKPYMVSWKADGTRYMLLIKQSDELYFFDRDNACFKISNLSFLDLDLKHHLRNTLLDGEMVIDNVNGLRTPRYLVYDIIYLENENVGYQAFKDRMRLIRDRIIAPRHKAIMKGIIRKEHEPFSVRMKDFWEADCAKKLLSDKFAKQLSHEPDGLIFQPKLDPYVCGRCDDVLKWKPSDQNSVDFKLKIVQESGVG
jgi:mRNA-capping enzyme